MMSHADALFGMPFISHFAPPSDAVALIDGDGGDTLTYHELHELVGDATDALQAVLAGAHAGGHVRANDPVFLLVRNDITSIVALFALRAAGHAVILVDAALDASLVRALHAAYKPAFFVSSDESLPNCAISLTISTAQRKITLHLSALTDQHTLSDVHPDMAYGLTTSGSTGSPKLVRLTEQAIVANARSIAAALDISADDRAITCLPLHYAYGLSLLTSHLAAGASLVVTDRGFMDGPFWTMVKTHGVTSLAGVPYMYEMLERLDPARAVPANVRVMTQAGGRLRDESVARLHTFMASRGGRFHVMYGQTEATARIAVMPHEWLPARLGSAGRAIPGGAIEIHDLDTAGDGDNANDGHTARVLAAGEEGEVCYRGPNVMLGYATTRDDLTRGDELGGLLRTGDIGRLDAEGCLTITGRLKRIGKLFGVRVDLDAIERQLSAEAPAAVLEGDNQLVVFTTMAASDASSIEALVQRLATQLRVQQRAIVVKSIDALPRTASGKMDYPALRRAL